jgi:hypothetical protein
MNKINLIKMVKELYFLRRNVILIEKNLTFYSFLKLLIFYFVGKIQTNLSYR